MRIGVLASGELGLTVMKFLNEFHEITFVMTDKKSILIQDFCKEDRIPIFVGNPRNGKSLDFISSKTAQVLISINYLFIIENNLILFPEKIAINVHGSLLPKYRGRTPHVWAIINNEKYTGITVHKIDQGCDTGDIIEQLKIPIDDEDTGADILKKYCKAYIPIIETALNKINSNQLQLVKQDETVASYFGKRTPDDGLINWNWQKERIKNWVRALAYPYPGAFTILNNNKLIIDKIRFSEYSYKQEMENGLVISTTPLKIKTPNGVIEIVEIRESVEKPSISIGDILNK
jgi:methionyl-tRNA formyltransferase